MKIKETTVPVERQFTLNVNEQELMLIFEAVTEMEKNLCLDREAQEEQIVSRAMESETTLTPVARVPRDWRERVANELVIQISIIPNFVGICNKYKK